MVGSCLATMERILDVGKTETDDGAGSKELGETAEPLFAKRVVGPEVAAAVAIAGSPVI